MSRCSRAPRLSEGSRRCAGPRPSRSRRPTCAGRAGRSDAVWDAQRLVVEVDGYKTHRPRAQFERDRRKDADLVLAGYRVLRFTWWRLTREPDQVIAILASTLRPSQGVERGTIGTKIGERVHVPIGARNEASEG